MKKDSATPGECFNLLGRSQYDRRLTNIVEIEHI